ncbi:probable asparagine--tRNA ligase, mitochondrial [Uloborus diversus]|uniref:probable asparagine--tRNA ligase, mitochondrial n=1 Tax=Uloborus diversus TaxID=327109 RepID=UPI00240931C6|nr:probable asparagine--tRNA ligase, mitochondrial [Uloborus diversus]
MIADLHCRRLGEDTLEGKEVLQKESRTKQGWVRALRKHKEIYFIDLVDGSSAERLQVLIAADKQCPSYGSSIQVEGSLVNSSHKGQTVEFHAASWKEIGGCHSDYPFAYGQKYSPEYVRQYLHLRPRTRKFSSILRIRNVASFAVHTFFQEQGFCFLHTPIITVNDCEGAGEVFSVKASQEVTPKQPGTTISKCIDGKLPEVASINKELSDDSDIDEEPSAETEEYFGSQAYMTVSGQLHLEAMASAMGPVYNFGPVFRAENSRTRQHASEFSMVEAEIPFISNLDSLLEASIKLD